MDLPHLLTMETQTLDSTNIIFIRESKISQAEFEKHPIEPGGVEIETAADFYYCEPKELQKIQYLIGK